MTTATTKSTNRTVMTFKGGKLKLPLASGKFLEFNLADFVLNTDPTFMGTENRPLLHSVYQNFLKGRTQKITVTFDSIALAGYIGDVLFDDSLFEGVALERNEKDQEDAPF